MRNNRLTTPPHPILHASRNISPSTLRKIFVYQSETGYEMNKQIMMEIDDENLRKTHVEGKLYKINGLKRECS